MTLPGVRQPFSGAALRSTWLSLQELPLLRCEVAKLRMVADWVEVSPAVRQWLTGLGRRSGLDQVNRVVSAGGANALVDGRDGDAQALGEVDIDGVVALEVVGFGQRD